MFYFPNWWLMIPLTVVAGAMQLRIYMIQHDCLHFAFFSSRRLNRFWGKLLSVISMTPFEITRAVHNLHHTHVSDLDRRDTFEIPVMTLDEWERASAWRRLHYRLYRSPITLVFVGPFLFYGLVRRLPIYGESNHYSDLAVHNLMLGGFLGTIWYLAGWPGVAIWAAAFYISSLGAIIPYVVHNFEDIHWGVKPELDFETAALEGSAVMDWGWFFDLVVMNIGYHDLHHLNAKIPGYKLKEAHNELERRGLIDPTKVGFLDGMRSLRWKLYDRENARMIPFPKPDKSLHAVPTN